MRVKNENNLYKTNKENVKEKKIINKYLV